MKLRTLLLISLLSTAALAFASGGNEPSGDDNSASKVVYVSVPRFAASLVNRWIEEYGKAEHGVKFEIVKGRDAQRKASLVVETQEDKLVSSDGEVVIGKFAVLPITTSNSEASKLLLGRQLNSKRLKQLYFLNDDFDDDDKKLKALSSLVVYSSGSASSVSGLVASHFGENTAQFRGKKIFGDDAFLNTAIKKDSLGVSFNVLPNIFDLSSRKVKDGISLIELDVKRDLAATLGSQATLDDVIGTLENNKIDAVTIGAIAAKYDSQNDAVGKFLLWILTEGKKYNHDYGMLNLEDATAEVELNKLQPIYTANK